MTIKLGLTTDGSNTQYAPLAVLFAHYQRNQLFAPLDQVKISMKSRDFTPTDKLLQVFVSMLAGCQTLSEVNQNLKPEPFLAKIGGWSRFADQSGLSRTLDALTLMNIDQLRKATHQIVEPLSQCRQHDWRGYLWCDFDLSGLPCGKRAEASQKEYFCGKKTSQVVNWHESMWSNTVKQCGRTCIRAISIQSIVCRMPWNQPKVH